MKKNCVFAGTFDPLSKGHESIINKAIKKYNTVFIVIGSNPDKTPSFSISQRKAIIKKAFPYQNVKVVCYDDYKENYANFLLNNEITHYVRGIRNKEDFRYEKQYEKINKKLYPFVKTVYLKPEKQYRNISSTLIKEKIKNNENYGNLVSESVYLIISEILKSEN